MWLMNAHDRKYYPLLISVMLHAMALLCCVSLTAHKKTTLGQNNASTINSYIYQDHASTVLTATKNQPKISAALSGVTRQVSARGLQKAHVTTKKIMNIAAEHPVAQQMMKRSPASQGQLASELVTLLHAAIQEKQHYPLSAQQMEREGRVTVKFTLFVDGTITHLRIAHSSGTTSLDEAAVAAVNEAAPFGHVEKFLEGPQEYVIDVVFALT